MTQNKLRLAFISPVFLFPNDAGGKIRTTNVLRGLQGGAFEVTLIGVASEAQESDWTDELASVCDRFIAWRPNPVKPKWLRAMDLLGQLPVNISADRTAAGLAAVRVAAETGNYDVIVFDFVHAGVLWPANLSCASVCFTHNVEAEIFQRHAEQAKRRAMRWMWASQYLKMQHFERSTLRRFTSVIAVSERDAQHFRHAYGVTNASAIPTGVDLDFFSWQAPPQIDAAHPPTVVFTGSMNWAANIDGIKFFLEHVWPGVRAACPLARLQVVGRDPPAALVLLAAAQDVELTGFVDDVRPYVHGAHAFIIPLLVGGGTRIKAFEAMAMGCPVVSTAIGMEGLEVSSGEHFLCADGAAALIQALLDLLGDEALRLKLSQQARRCVEDQFGHRVAAAVFESICLDAVETHRQAPA
ncbi:MAG: glycosyltransferase [Pseudomonadota bacterium]